VILSGTPAGVGPVQKGDTMTISVEGVGEMTVTVT
jgi:fumarylpyruvate hydrolase